MSMVHVIAVITAKPGLRDQVLGLFRANVPAVKEEDGCIERESAQRLQRDFASQIRSAAQREEAPGARPGRPVLGKISPGLAHEPYRRAVDGFARERPQQAIVHRPRRSLRARMVQWFAASRSGTSNVIGCRPP